MVPVPTVEPLTAENMLWANTVLAAGSAVGSSNRNYGAQNGVKAGGASGGAQAAATPERRFSQPDRASPAPPIVVVSPDAHGEAGQRGAGAYGEHCDSEDG